MRVYYSVMVIGIAVVVGCAPGLFSRAPDDRVIISPYVSTPPVIDSDLSDWDTSTFITVTPENGVFDLELGPDAHSDDVDNLSFRFAVANDDEYLYVACIVKDDVIVLDTNPDPTAKHCKAWKDDTVEIFIDGNHNRSDDRGGDELLSGGEFSTVANGAVTSWSSSAPDK